MFREIWTITGCAMSADISCQRTLESCYPLLTLILLMITVLHWWKHYTIALHWCWYWYWFNFPIRHRLHLLIIRFMMWFDLEQKVQRRHAESWSLILTNHYGHDVSTGHWAELSWWRVTVQSSTPGYYCAGEQLRSIGMLLTSPQYLLKIISLTINNLVQDVSRYY